MRFVPTDLHGHTLYSDGRAYPEQYVDVRARAGLQVIAVADHDVFTAVRPAASAAAQRGIVLIPAAELTSVLHFGTSAAEQIHVLAYYPPEMLEAGRLERTALYQRGQRVQTRWREFVLAWMHELEPSAHAPLGLSALEALAPSRFPALQAVLDRVAVAAPDHSPAFHRHHVRFWHEDRDLFGWTPEELSEAIRADGALDVVAHPVRYRDKARLEQILSRASGIEVYTSRHNPRVAARFRAQAEALGKFWTASTDDHQRDPYAAPACGTPLSTLERIFGHALGEHFRAPELRVS